MKPDNLRIDERASIALRALYRKYGYLPYQVNTFEEYTLSYGSSAFHHSTVSPCALCHADSFISARFGKPVLSLS